MTSHALASNRTGPATRHALICVGVVVFHVAVLWALQSGLLRRAVEIVVPAQILSEFVTPPAPKVEPPPLPPPPPEVKPTLIKPLIQPQPPVPVAAPQPMPVAIADTTPAPAAPVGVTTPQPPPPPIAAPPVAVAPPAPPPPAPAKVEPPIIDADYAANEELFRAPAASQRLGEYGRVLLSVTVGVNGFASSVAVLDSSGYPRLDNAAIAGAKKLKFRPATRNGVPVEWTYKLPVNYSEPK